MPHDSPDLDTIRRDLVHDLLDPDNEPTEEDLAAVRHLAEMSDEELAAFLAEGEGDAADEDINDSTDEDRLSLASDPDDANANANASALVDALIDHGATAAKVIADEIRAKVRSLVKKNDLTSPIDRELFLQEVRWILAEHEPLLARVLSDSLLAAWIFGADEVSADLEPIRDPIEPLPPVIPPRRPPITATSAGGSEDESENVRFPGLERAVQSLIDRQVMMPLDVARLESGARQTAFQVAGVQSADTLRALRDALAGDVAEGGTLRGFRQRALDVLADHGEAPLSPARIETLYRTEVGLTHARAMASTVAHPLVSDEFPYLLYTAVHDSRVRPEHLQMEKLGLDGTAVYRRDDPIWDKFLPPWSFNCRCATVPLSVEDAARRGVREAQEWLNTGVPPRNAKHVKAPPFAPPEGFEGVRLSLCCSPRKGVA